jgi:hypothetical protein
MNPEGESATVYAPNNDSGQNLPPPTSNGRNVSDARASGTTVKHNKIGTLSAHMRDVAAVNRQHVVDFLQEEQHEAILMLVEEMSYHQRRRTQAKEMLHRLLRSGKYEGAASKPKEGDEALNNVNESTRDGRNMEGTI